MLKADTQGFEDAVLDGANLEKNPLSLVVLEMSIEPLYRGQVLMPDLITRMLGMEYRLGILEPSDVDYSDLSLLQMDGWFFRRES